MKKIIDGQTVEGTPAEIAEYEAIVATRRAEQETPKRPVKPKLVPVPVDETPDAYYRLTPQLKDAFDAMQIIGGQVRAEQMAELLGTTRQCASQRMAKLHAMGLVAKPGWGVYAPLAEQEARHA